MSIPPADIYIDFAAYGNLYYQTDTQETYKANLMRVIDLIDTIEDYKLLILTSSSSVTLPKQTNYSLSKKAMEEYVSLYQERTKKPIIVVRPYSVIGVGEQKEHLIPKLIRSCLYGERMDFVAEPTHDFIDVRDFAYAIEVIIHNAKDYYGSIIPIGSGVQHTNQEVRMCIEQITGQQANILTVSSLRDYDTKNWQADTTALSAMGWKPRYTIEDTLHDMIKHERETTNNQL